MRTKARNINSHQIEPKIDPERPLSDSLESALKLINYLTTPEVTSEEDKRVIELSNNFLPPTEPACLYPPDPRKIVAQFPKKWRKQISEVVW